MRVAFRADASQAIGSGHVMRCLALADALRGRGASVQFVCRQHAGNLSDLIEGRGYSVARLPAPDAVPPTLDPARQGLAYAEWLGATWTDDARQTVQAVAADGTVDWMVVDHYGIDAAWESCARSTARRVLVIDDLADRRHDCDILVDQNLHDDPLPRYAGLVPASCVRLLGPAYALLRPEFAAARRVLRRRSGEVRRVLVSFGGVDATNETAKAVAALLMMRGPRIDVDVVVGAGNPHWADIEAACIRHEQLHFLFQPDSMARLMAVADLAIGASGVTTWERCCVGLPAIVVAVAANQVPIAEALARRGACLYLGESSVVSVQDVRAAVGACVSAPAQLRQMSAVGLDLTTGDGPDRVCEQMLDRRRGAA